MENALPRRMSILPCALVASLLLGGCAASIHAEPLNPPVRPMIPKDPSEVMLLTQRAERPFVEVSTLEILNSSTDFSSGTLFSKLRAAGAERGCDAVIVVGRSDGTPLFERHREEGYLASCIQYLDEVAPTPATPAAAAPRPRGNGSVCFAPGHGHSVLEVDRRDYQVAGGCVVVSCGRHLVRGGGPAKEVDVPCGEKLVLD